jgi:2-dehydropantoate 2-reductase
MAKIFQTIAYGSYGEKAIRWLLSLLKKPMSTPINIAVVGAGNIGSAFAYQLATAGKCHVTVIARPGSDRLNQLRRDDAIVKDSGERAKVTVCDRIDPATAFDLVIVTVPVQQLDVLLPALRDSVATSMLFMCNQFEPKRLRDQIGAARCDFGMPFVQASLDADGRLHAVIGAGGQKTKLGRQRWVDLFNSAGLPAMIEPDMLLWLRCHAPMCVAFESVSVAGMRRDGGASWQEASTIALGMQTCFALIRAGGEPLYPAGKARLAASPRWVPAAMLWTISRIPSFRTLLAQGINECRALADIMAQFAKQSAQHIDAASITAMKPGAGDR